MFFFLQIYNTYFCLPQQVEEMMFQLICDPAGVVVETSMKELVPAVIKWGNKLDHVLRVLMSHILSSAQVCFFLTIFSVCVGNFIRRH